MLTDGLKKHLLDDWSDEISKAFSPEVWSHMLMKNYVQMNPGQSAAGSAAPQPECPRRRGRFSLPDPTASESGYWAAMGIMARCVIISAERNMVTGCIDYTAICPLFDAISAGEVIPQYEWTVEGDNIVATRKPDPVRPSPLPYKSITDLIARPGEIIKSPEELSSALYGQQMAEKAYREQESRIGSIWDRLSTYLP